MSRRRARGSATVLIAVAVLLAGVIAAAVVLYAAYVSAEHRAGGAADLAALSAASAYASGGDPCSQARRVAAANDTRLSACRLSGDSLDFVVAVTVEAHLDAAAWLPQVVTASAEAGHLTPV